MLLKVLKQVFQSKEYLFLATGVASGFLLLAILLPNIRLLFQLFQNFDLPLLKAKLLVNLLLGIQTNFTPVNRIFSLIISVLMGIYASLLVFFIKKREKYLSHSTSKTGLAGFVSGILGAGCVSCGSFILSTIFSTAGAARIIALLPFRGAEFSVFSMILLSLSIYILTRNIEKAGLCKR